MQDEPRVFVSLERTINLGQYESMRVSVGLSQIPATANEDLIQIMLGTAQMTFEILKTDLDLKARAILDAHRAPQAQTPTQSQPVEAVKKPLGSAFGKKPEPVKEESQQRHTNEEVRAYGHTYTGMPIAPESWNVAITEASADGRPGGQLKLINTLFTKRGVTDDDRVRLCLILLRDMGYRQGELVDNWVDSVKSLCKAEAQLLIGWLSDAPDGAVAAAVKAAQELDPFEEDAA